MMSVNHRQKQTCGLSHPDVCSQYVLLSLMCSYMAYTLTIEASHTDTVK